MTSASGRDPRHYSPTSKGNGLRTSMLRPHFFGFFSIRKIWFAIDIPPIDHYPVSVSLVEMSDVSAHGRCVIYHPESHWPKWRDDG